MTTSTPTIDALLAACQREPDEDTPRLMLADELEQQEPVRVVCPKCQGTGYVSYEESPYGGTTTSSCHACQQGTTIDTAAHDRAELIRVQCELERDVGAIAAWQAGRYQDSPDLFAAHGERRHYISKLESVLIAEHGKRWRTGPKCEKCEGRGGNDYDAMNKWDCAACGATGDAGGLTRCFNYSHDHGNGTVHGEDELVRIEWHRGFMRVIVPTLADAVEEFEIVCPYCEEASMDPETGVCECGRRDCENGATDYRPTPWLAAVCEHHPFVLECVALDQVPTREEGGWEWYGLPDKLNTPETKATFDTADLAITALSRAIVRFART